MSIRDRVNGEADQLGVGLKTIVLVTNKAHLAVSTPQGALSTTKPT